MQPPLLTFLITYKTPIRLPGHNFCDIKSLFNHLEKVFTISSDRHEMEFLIKVDSDDDKAISDLKDLEKCPFHIRTAICNKWEGRWSFNYYLMYLFSLVNPKTNFIGIITDDCRLLEGYGHELLEELKTHIDNEYVIFYGSPNLNYYNRWNLLERFKDATPEAYLKSGKEWPGAYEVFANHIVSRKVIECMGSMGYVSFVDITFSLLPVILAVNYKVDILKTLQYLITDRKDNPRSEKRVIREFNRITLLSEKEGNKDSYFYTLIEQQAKNIYLNMKADGVI